MKKCLIVVAGGSGAGKTTTTQAFAIGAPEQHKESRIVKTVKGIRPMDVYWTVYDNCAVVGDHRGGSDSNIGPGAMRESLFECLAVRDVVILDGYVSSPQWAMFANEWAIWSADHTLEILFVHFVLTVEVLVERKAKRLGKTYEELAATQWDRCLEGVARPARLLMHFENLCKVPMTIVEVYESDTTEDIVELYEDCVCEILGDC